MEWFPHPAHPVSAQPSPTTVMAFLPASFCRKSKRVAQAENDSRPKFLFQEEKLSQ